MNETPSLSRRLFDRAGGCAGCAVMFSTVFGLAIGFGFGLVYAELRGYGRQYLVEKEQIEPILASDPAFSKVTCIQRSSGGVDLGGTVPTQADHDRLRERIVRIVGERRANEIVLSVMVFRDRSP